MQTRRRPRLTQIRILTQKPTSIRIVIPCLKVIEIRLGILLMPGKRKIIKTITTLPTQVAPGVVAIARLDRGVGLAEMNRAAKRIEVIKLAAFTGMVKA